MDATPPTTTCYREREAPKAKRYYRLVAVLFRFHRFRTGPQGHLSFYQPYIHWKFFAMEALLVHAAITPAILQKIIQKMNYKELAVFSRTSTFGEWAVEYFRGQEIKEIEKAKLAEIELKKILFPANEEQLSLPLLKAYKNTSKWLVESAEKELDETKQYPNIPTGLVEMTEERLQRIRHTVELVEVVMKFWNILHSGEEKTKQIYFDDSVFG